MISFNKLWINLLLILLFSLPLTALSQSKESYYFDDGILKISEDLTKKITATSGQKIKIAVVGIQHLISKEKWDISTSIEQGIILNLNKNLKFIVFERNQIKALEAEKLYKLSGIQIGESVGAEIVITGGYEIWNEKYLRLSLKAIQVSNSQIIASASIDIKTQNITFLLKQVYPKNSITELQQTIADQNEKIERLRKQTLDHHSKQRMLRIIQEQTSIIKELEYKSRSTKIPYTTRKYNENLAFINIESMPSNQDVYINDKWVGKTPVRLYEIEAGVKHKITVRADPRFYYPKEIVREYTKFERTSEKFVLEKGTAEVLILTEFLIERIIINGKDVNFDQTKAAIEIEAGHNRIEIFDNNGYATFELDIWSDDIIRKDIEKSSYTSTPFSTALDDLLHRESLFFYYSPGWINSALCRSSNDTCNYNHVGINLKLDNGWMFGLSKVLIEEELENTSAKDENTSEENRIKETIDWKGRSTNIEIGYFGTKINSSYDFGFGAFYSLIHSSSGTYTEESKKNGTIKEKEIKDHLFYGLFMGNDFYFDNLIASCRIDLAFVTLKFTDNTSLSELVYLDLVFGIGYWF